MWTWQCRELGRIRYHSSLYLLKATSTGSNGNCRWEHRGIRHPEEREREISYNHRHGGEWSDIQRPIGEETGNLLAQFKIWTMPHFLKISNMPDHDAGKSRFKEIRGEVDVTSKSKWNISWCEDLRRNNERKKPNIPGMDVTSLRKYVSCLQLSFKFKEDAVHNDHICNLNLIRLNT